MKADLKHSRNLQQSYQLQQPYESPVISELKVQTTTSSPIARPTQLQDTCPILTGTSKLDQHGLQRDSSCSPASQVEPGIPYKKQSTQDWARVHTNQQGRRYFNASIVGVFSCASELDPSNDLTLDIRLAKPAIDLAIEAAKRSYSEHINFHVSYRSTPDICKHQQAGGHAAEEFFTNGATYFVGPGCSESLSSMGQLASYWRVPMCSTGFLPEIEAYRFKPMTMIQLSLSIQSVGEMFLELFRRYNWHHLVIVTDDKHPLHSIIRNGLLDFFITFERTNSKTSGFNADLATSSVASPQRRLFVDNNNNLNNLNDFRQEPQEASILSSSRKLQEANENWRRQNYRRPERDALLLPQLDPKPLLINNPFDTGNNNYLHHQQQQQQQQHQHPRPSISVPYVKAQGLVYKEQIVAMSPPVPPSDLFVNPSMQAQPSMIPPLSPPQIFKRELVIDYEQTILEASNHSHIMLLLAGSDTVRELLRAAHKHQMSWGQYVFLAHELFGNIKMEQQASNNITNSKQFDAKTTETDKGQNNAIINDVNNNDNVSELHNLSSNAPHSDLSGDHNRMSDHRDKKCAFNLSNFGDRLEISPIPGNQTDEQLLREMFSPLIIISFKVPFSHHFGTFIQEVARLSEQEFNHCIDMNNLKSVYSLGIAALVYDCVMLYAYGAEHLIKNTNSSTIDGETLFDWISNRNFASKLTGSLSVNRAGQRVIDFSLNTFMNESMSFEPRAHFIAMRKQLEFLQNKSTYWEALQMEPPSSDPHCRLGDPFACQYIDSQSMRDAFSQSGGRLALGIWLLIALILSVALTSSLVGWLIYRRFRIESELLNLWWSIKYEDIIFEDDAEALQDVKRSMSSLAISQDSFAAQAANPAIVNNALNICDQQQQQPQQLAIESPNGSNKSLGGQNGNLNAAQSGRSTPSQSRLTVDHLQQQQQQQMSSSLGPTSSIMSAENSGKNQQSSSNNVDKQISTAHSISSLSQSVCSSSNANNQQQQRHNHQQNQHQHQHKHHQHHRSSQLQVGSGQNLLQNPLQSVMGLSSQSIGKFSINTTAGTLNSAAGIVAGTTASNQQITGHMINKNKLYTKQGSKNATNKATGNCNQDSGRRRQQQQPQLQSQQSQQSQQQDQQHNKDPSISSQNKNVKLKLGTVLNGGRDQQFATKVGMYKASRVAAKHLNVKNLNINRQLLIELRQVRDLTHENLIKFIGLCPEEPNVAIVSELCTRGNLQDLLQNDAIRLDWSFRYSIINDIVDGLQHLHSSPIQHHGRLKSSNCVIDNRFVVKLTDFGLPSLLASVELDEQVVNPRHLLWTAPEHLRTKHPLLSGSAKGDIYSLAIILQEIITRCGPFECEPILCASAQAAASVAAGAVNAAAANVIVTADTPLVRISPGSGHSGQQTRANLQKTQPRLYQQQQQQQLVQQPIYQPMIMVQHKQRLEPDEIVNLVRMGLSPPFRPYFRPDLLATVSNSNPQTTTAASAATGNQQNQQQQQQDGFNLADLIALVQGCWQENPASRPSIGSVKQQIKKTRRGHHLEGSNLMDNLLQRMERYTDNLESLVEQKTAELMEEKKRSEELLYEMLPRFVVDQLRYGHSVTPEAYEAVTIGFSDIKDFTSISAQSSPIEVVNLLNQLYTEFDDCIAQYDVYKVETIGDAYMVVSGLPIRNGDQHASEIADMSLALLDLIRDFEIVHLPEVKLELRIGIHSGPCASGVVGTKMFRYCLFGDTVSKFLSVSNCYFFIT